MNLWLLNKILLRWLWVSKKQINAVKLSCKIKQDWLINDNKEISCLVLNPFVNWKTITARSKELQIE